MSISLCIYLYMVYEYADFLASLPYMFFFSFELVSLMGENTGLHLACYDRNMCMK